MANTSDKEQKIKAIDQILDEIKPDIHQPVYSYSQAKLVMELYAQQLQQQPAVGYSEGQLKSAINLAYRHGKERFGSHLTQVGVMAAIGNPAATHSTHTENALKDLIDKARSYNDGWNFTVDELLSEFKATPPKPTEVAQSETDLLHMQFPGKNGSQLFDKNYEEEALQDYLKNLNPKKEETELDMMLSWVAIFYGAVHGLVNLKDYKDKNGKDEYYLEEQPKQWYAAQQAIQLWEQSDYGAKPFPGLQEIGRNIADLNHVIVNACMNAMAMTKDVSISDELTKILEQVRLFTKNYKAQEAEDDHPLYKLKDAEDAFKRKFSGMYEVEECYVWVKIAANPVPNDPNELCFRRKKGNIYQYIQTDEFEDQYLIFNGEEIPYNELEWLSTKAVKQKP